MPRKHKTSDFPAILAKLDEVERELKAIGFWSDGPAPEQTGNFMEMAFELWLQWVFLLNARKAAEEGRLPEHSDVGVIALRQYDYHSHAPEAEQLLHILIAFDKLVKG